MQHEGDMGVGSCDPLAIYIDLAAGRGAEPRGDIEQGRFSTTGRAYQRNHLAIGDLDRYVVNRGDFLDRLTAAGHGAEFPGYVAEFKSDRGHGADAWRRKLAPDISGQAASIRIRNHPASRIRPRGSGNPSR